MLHFLFNKKAESNFPDFKGTLYALFLTDSKLAIKGTIYVKIFPEIIKNFHFQRHYR